MELRTLPNFQLSPRSATARAFLQHGFGDYHHAVMHVKKLPWTHAADTGDYHAVLRDGCGTIAAKHALLAALAGEHGVSVQLVLAVYEMNAANTPAAAGVLRRHRADSVLDAACWLRYSDERIDLSREPVDSARLSVLHEEVISLGQIAAYRLAVYQRHVWDWSEARGWTMERASEVRQACIKAFVEQLSAEAAESG